MKCNPFRRCLLLVAVSLVLAGPVSAAPRDELLRLVPDDVGFLLLVQDLRTHWADLAGSPFVAEVRQTPVGKAIAQSPEVRKLRGVSEQLKMHLGVDAAQLRDDLFGDAFLMAYRPPPAEHPEHEQGLFLLRAKDANVLADLVQRFNAAQKEDGSLRDTETRKHAGETYHLRIERTGKHYYFLRGPVLAFSSSEEMIKQVIDLSRKPAEHSPPLVARLKKLGVESAAILFWVNPRPFDAEVELKVKVAQEPEVYFVKKTQAYWKALDGIALTLSLRSQDIELGLALLAREAELPASGRQLFAVQETSSDLWQRFPEHTLAAMAGQIDAKAMSDFVADFLPAEARQKLREGADRGAGAALGLDVVKDVFPNLGPDWGFCVTAPSGKDSGILPASLTALRVSPGSGKKPIDEALLSGLNSLAILAVLGNNNSRPEKISLVSEKHDKVEVKYLTGDHFPAGFRPAFALKDGYLLLATSPEAIRAFGSRKNADKPSAGLLARVSFRAVGTYLEQHREALATHIAQRQNLSADEVKRRFDGLLTLCRFIDSAELSRHAGPGKLALLLHVKAAKPLKK